MLVKCHTFHLERERERARRKGTLVTFLWHFSNLKWHFGDQCGTLVTQHSTLSGNSEWHIGNRYGTLVTKSGILVTNVAHW